MNGWEDSIAVQHWCSSVCPVPDSMSPGSASHPWNRPAKSCWDCWYKMPQQCWCSNEAIPSQGKDHQQHHQTVPI